jgi:AAA family ATP:ADP antiporter
MAVRGESGAGEREEPPRARATANGFKLVLGDRYLRLLAFMLLVATIINTTGEYVIGRMATDRAHLLAAAARDDYLSAFYSDYYTLVNVASAVLQGLVVARVLTTFGVRRALFIMPVIVLGGWLALALYANLLMVRIEKTTENSLDYSLHNTVRQALFLPTSREGKYQGKAAIDTFFFRMGDVIAGLGIVFVLVQVLGLGVRAFAILNVGLAVVWIALAARAGRLHDEMTTDGER